MLAPAAVGEGEEDDGEEQQSGVYSACAVLRADDGRAERRRGEERGAGKGGRHLLLPRHLDGHEGGPVHGHEGGRLRERQARTVIWRWLALPPQALARCRCWCCLAWRAHRWRGGSGADEHRAVDHAKATDAGGVGSRERASAGDLRWGAPQVISLTCFVAVEIARVMRASGEKYIL